MAYDFLSLTNDVAKRLNETELTSTNFAAASGFYAAIKEAVNSAIRHVNQSHFGWPFNHNVYEQTLTAGITRYPIPTQAKYVDFDTYRVRRNTTLGVGRAEHLTQLSYDEYVDRYIDQEDETDVTKGAAPQLVFRTQNAEFGVVPMPDKAYQVDFEYFMDPVDLILNTDVPTIPERFRHVIIDGAMYYAYMFRDNIEMASVSQRKFDEGIKQMRTVTVNENVYMRAS